LQLVERSHRFFDVEPGIDLFAWVEYVLRVKDVFGLFEQLKHPSCEHFVQVWGADDAVVVFTADVAVVLDGRLKELVCHFSTKSGVFVGEVQ